MAGDTTEWTLKGYQALVNGTPFFANGVSYSPVPWGACTSFEPYGDFTIKTWSSVWQRDVALMRKNAVNLLKTYNTLNEVQTPHGDVDHGAFLDACWNGGTDPIYVLMGYAPANNVAFYQPSSWSQYAGAREKIAGELVALAKKYAKYPALMGVVMANEINANTVIGNAAFFQFWNDVSVKIAAAAPGKLTLIANVDDSMNTVNAGNAYMTSPGFFWGYNSYRGNWTNSNGFDNLFSTFATATAANPRPLMLTEWGAPASTHQTAGGTVNIAEMTKQQMADLCVYVSGHYKNMQANSAASGQGSAVCCGGAYFEWTDEWWKADPIACNAPNAAPACYSGLWNPGPNMSGVGNFPGGYWDEEGFGLNAIAAVSPSSRVPVVAGGCIGPWNPQTNAPYAPDTLTARAHARTLFGLFGAKAGA